MEIAHDRTASCDFVAVSVSVLKLSKPQHIHSPLVSRLGWPPPCFLVRQSVLFLVVMDQVATVVKDCSPSNKTEEDGEMETMMPEQKEANNNGKLTSVEHYLLPIVSNHEHHNWSFTSALSANRWCNHRKKKAMVNEEMNQQRLTAIIASFCPSLSLSPLLHLRL